MGRTADSLIQALLLDDPEYLTPGATVDFGLDINPDLFAVYVKALRDGKINPFNLREASCSGPKLSALLGVESKQCGTV